MAILKAKFSYFTFPNNWKVFESKIERRLTKHNYPHMEGVEHEDTGSDALVLTIECVFTEEQAENFSYLQDLFTHAEPDSLYIPGRGIFWCRFEKMQVEEREGEKFFRRCRLEFVETLKDDLSIDITEDFDTQLDEILKKIKQAKALAEFWKAKKKEKGTPGFWDAIKKVYSDVIDFATSITSKVNSIKQKVKDLRDDIERPYKEFSRLAGEIEMLAVEAVGLYKDIIKYADISYPMARAIKNIANILTGVARQFSPPPKVGNTILAGQMNGKTVIYTVKSGDTFESICVDFYESVAPKTCVMEANAINDSLNLKVGDILIIPEIEGRPFKKVTVKLPKSEVGKATCLEL